jgi:hypothetical protein
MATNSLSPDRVSSDSLSPEQVARYERDGILFPVSVLSRDEVARARAAFEEIESRCGGKLEYAAWLHLFFRWAYDLATHPSVLNAVERLIGHDILASSTLLLCKHPRSSSYTSWHQDGAYSSLHLTPTTTAWLALSDSNAESGCMRVLPGSHKRDILPHVEPRADDDLLRRGGSVRLDVDERDTRDVVLRAGEMSLHHSKLVHGSGANRAGEKRIGFIVRYVTPQFKHAAAPVVRARGGGDCRHFEIVREPPIMDMDAGFAAWAEHVSGAQARQ